MVGYRSSVYNHLIPGVGAHRIDKLQPEHLESLYGRLMKPKEQGGKGLKPATVHLTHRTVRVALNEAVRRKHITENPAKLAKPPRVEEDEIIPFTVEEARRILQTSETWRNGTRFVVALTLGLRRGEALGLKWGDIEIKWRHGCETTKECRNRAAQLCELKVAVEADDHPPRIATVPLEARVVIQAPVRPEEWRALPAAAQRRSSRHRRQVQGRPPDDWHPTTARSRP